MTTLLPDTLTAPSTVDYEPTVSDRIQRVLYRLENGEQLTNRQLYNGDNFCALGLFADESGLGYWDFTSPVFSDTDIIRYPYKIHRREVIPPFDDDGNEANIWSDGTTIWVNYKGSDKIYAYDILTKSYNENKSFLAYDHSSLTLLPYPVKDLYGFNSVAGVFAMSDLPIELQYRITEAFGDIPLLESIVGINDKGVKRNHPDTNTILADIIRSGVLFK